jgi:histidinol-phosphatase (PHP family)
MKIKEDYHIHGEFSSDSKMDYNKLIKRAIEEKYTRIGFAEHFDCGDYDLYKYGLPSVENYCRRINQLKEKYSSKIEIFTGLEIGEYHRNYKLVDSLLKRVDIDYLIGSIHILPDETNVSIPVENEFTADQILSYYQENLKMVEFGKIDIVGHLGIYKRYMSPGFDEIRFQPIIKKILKKIIDKGLILEVNFSGMRKKYGSCIPDIKTLEMYKSLGGKRIVLSSDAHQLRDFNDYYESVYDAVIALDFEIVQLGL